MAEHTAKVHWARKSHEAYIDNKYSRAHEWHFDGGAHIPASSSPHVVPLPYSDATAVDPEEAFIASLASCHMLFFLSIAAKKKFIVEAYTDNAVGIMGKNAQAKTAVTQVTLRPLVTFANDQQPSTEELEHMHHQAHELCFIANSVTTEITIDMVRN